MVREDGEPEPALELEASERAEASLQDLPADVQGPLGDLDRIGLPEGQAQEELELGLPPPRAPSAPPPIDERGRLSPNLVALFGTLLGIATVASLIALAMNLEVKLPESAPKAAPSLLPPLPVTPAAPPPKAKRARQKTPGPWRIEDAKNDARTRLIEGKIGSDAFLKALEKAGVDARETYRILASMRGVRDFDHCKKSDRFMVMVDRGSSRVKAFEYGVSLEEVYQSKEGADGLLKGSRLDLKVDRNQISGALLADGKSFEASADRAGFDAGLSKVVQKALDGHLEMAEIEAGDRVRVIVQEVTVLGDFARYAGVEALEIRPAEAGRSAFRLYYFDSPGERGYYDAEGRSPYEGGWRKPIPDAPQTSPYNLKRMHPILKKIMPHLGIDFAAPVGTPVGASSFGTVSFIGYGGPAGNLVKIQHTGDVETGYAHLSRFAEGLKAGDHVKRRQLVGYVGSTGRSTGPHLHFSASRKGEFFDPASLRLDAMRSVSKGSREAFAAVKAKYDALLDAIPLPEPLPLPPPPPPPSQSAPASSSKPALPGIALDPMEGEEEATPDLEGKGHDDGAGTPPAAAPPAAPTPGKGTGNAVHLTDKELLELQGATDDGEVTE